MSYTQMSQKCTHSDESQQIESTSTSSTLCDTNIEKCETTNADDMLKERAVIADLKPQHLLVGSRTTNIQVSMNSEPLSEPSNKIQVSSTNQRKREWRIPKLKTKEAMKGRQRCCQTEKRKFLLGMYHSKYTQKIIFIRFASPQFQKIKNESHESWHKYTRWN